MLQPRLEALLEDGLVSRGGASPKRYSAGPLQVFEVRDEPQVVLEVDEADANDRRERYLFPAVEIERAFLLGGMRCDRLLEIEESTLLCLVDLLDEHRLPLRWHEPVGARWMERCYTLSGGYRETALAATGLNVRSERWDQADGRPEACHRGGPWERKAS
jgi:hypothetical protein